MEKKLLNIAVQVTGPSTTKQLEGRDHLVFPAVLVREQVLSNNLGRTFLPAAEIEASVDSWNHTPVVIRHPSKRGMPVSARSPDVLNGSGVGRLFNARFDGGALKAEVWIDQARAQAVADAAGVVNGVQNGEVGEVSTGFATQVEHAPGKFGDADYDYVLHDIRPDHFALLPDEIGACSVTDGCGLGVNHAGDCEPEAPRVDANRAQWTEMVRDAFNRALQAVGLAHNDDTNDDGASAPDNPPVDADGATPEEGSSMNREQMIAHLAGAGTDKAALEKLSDCQLKALCTAADATNVDPEPTLPPERPDDSEALKLAHHYRRKAEEAEAQFGPAAENIERERANLIDDIVYNRASAWTFDDLRAKPIEEVRKIHSTMFPARNYVGRGGPRAGVTQPTGSFDFVADDIFATKEAN